MAPGVYAPPIPANARSVAPGVLPLPIPILPAYPSPPPIPIGVPPGPPGVLTPASPLLLKCNPCPPLETIPGTTPPGVMNPQAGVYPDLPGPGPFSSRRELGAAIVGVPNDGCSFAEMFPPD